MPGSTDGNEIQAGRAFAPALQAAIAGMLGKEVETRPGADQPPPADSLIWVQRFEGLPEAAVWTAVPEALWKAVGGAVLQEAGLDPEDAESRSTFLEVLSQAFSGFAQAASRIQGSVIDSVEGKELSEAPAGAHWENIEIQIEGQAVPPIAVAFSAGWAQLGATTSSALAPPKPAGPQSVDAPAENAGPPRTFDLLLDVELPVSVSFGRAQLPLKDVIKLTTGSIVELNRSVSQPVEIIVNNCVIARGEVVVIEGNYGVRVAQIISRQDRLRTLR